MKYNNRVKNIGKKKFSGRIILTIFFISSLTSVLGQNPNAVACKLSALPSIQFQSKSVKLLKNAQAILQSVATQLRANPLCKVKVTSYGVADKLSQQNSWDRVNNVIRYLAEKAGISEDRFIFNYGQQGDPNTVDLIPTTEDGPITAPAPHPQLRATK